MKPPPHAGELTASLLTELPDWLAVGDGTALFLAGRCHHASRAIQRLSLGCGDTFARAIVHGGARRRAGHPGDIWWGLVPIAAVERDGQYELVLRALLSDGREATTSLASLQLRRALPYRSLSQPKAHDSRTAICMATWNPDPELFRRQVESIRGQSDSDWICVIADDASDPGALAAMKEVLEDDRRFVLRAFDERVGVYRNFERALAMAPQEASFIALSDQDDIWNPEKLETLRAAFGPATQLAYSDMRLVTTSDEVLSDTFWTLRETNYTDLQKLLLGNTVTGAAAMMRRDLLDAALPFPPRLGELFHDHWLASLALSLGDVAYVDRPLFDYVQHLDSIQGHGQANYGARRPRSEWLKWARLLPKVALGDHVPKFYTQVYLPTVLMAQVIEARCAQRVPGKKREVISAFSNATHGFAMARDLLPGALRPGLRRTATLGRERSFLAGTMWQALVRARSRAGIGPAPTGAGWSRG